MYLLRFLSAKGFRYTPLCRQKQGYHAHKFKKFLVKLTKIGEGNAPPLCKLSFVKLS